MNTEITDNKSVAAANVVFYDDACAFCLAWARRFGPLLMRRGFTFAPLPGERTEMRVNFADGQSLGGADAVVALARRIWWAWPLWLVAQFPGVIHILRATYRHIADRRHCLNGACTVRRPHTWLDWLPLVLLPTLVFPTINLLPAWIFMWAIAFALFLGCKWLAWRRRFARRRKSNISKVPVLSPRSRGEGNFAGETLRILAYWLGWPGMDANAFLNDGDATKPPFLTWLAAIAKTLLGTGLIYLAATDALPPLARGWLGMIGIIFVLHFGTFHLLALLWQTCGIPAKPLMRAPLLATSLADFWGARWNTAFNALAHDLTFRPLARKLGLAGATLGTFLISGLIHDLVISLPARAGFGLPTAYFLLQGLGVMFERSKLGRALGLTHGFRGGLFMFVVTAAPVYWLFHPPFIHNVILPMLQAIGATLQIP